MKIFVIASKYNYHRIEDIKKELENKGHIITLPNYFEDPFLEERIKLETQEKHQQFKARNYLVQRKKVADNDAVLVINFEKNGIANYLGGATFLEMYEAFMQNKKIFMYNPIPEGMLKDEIIGFNPIIINGNIDLIK